MASAQSIESLISQLADYRGRHAARMTIEAMGPSVADRLLLVLGDASLPENMRWSVLALLVAWKHLPAAGAILEVAREDRGLHSEAFRALSAITGLEIGEDADEWEKALADPAAYAAQAAAERRLEEEAEEEDPEKAGYNLLRRAVGSVASEFKWEEEGYLYMRFPLPGGRKQQMIATFQAAAADGNPMTTLYTECGAATPGAAELISRRNVTAKYGQFVLDGEPGEQKVVMRHVAPTGELTEQLAHDILLSMAFEADSMENELGQCDRI